MYVQRLDYSESVMDQKTKPKDDVKSKRMRRNHGPRGRSGSKISRNANPEE
jgi:hypothetical protein